MKLIKGAAGLSIAAIYILVSNWEIGNAGNWAWYIALGISLFWTSLLFMPEIKKARRCGNTKRAKTNKSSFTL